MTVTGMPPLCRARIAARMTVSFCLRSWSFCLRSWSRLSSEIEQFHSIINNHDTSKDGQFIGWQVTHKYRASNSKGVVSFGNVMVILDSQMQQCYLYFSLDDNNKSYQAIKTVIENELEGIK